MVKRLIINICGNDDAHVGHDYRPAIFGLGRKVRCPGIKRAESPNNIHRHSFRYSPTHSDDAIMIWRCRTRGCSGSMNMLRSVFNHETLGVPLDWFVQRWNT